MSKGFHYSRRVQFSETDLAGIYKIRLGAHPREYLCAVNVPASSEAFPEYRDEPFLYDSGAFTSARARLTSRTGMPAALASASSSRTV